MESKSCWTRKRKERTWRQQRQRQVKKFEQMRSLTRLLIRRRTPPSNVGRTSYATAILVRSVKKALQSGKLALHDSTFTDSPPFCYVYHNENHKTLQYQKIRIDYQFARIWNQEFQYFEPVTTLGASNNEGKRTTSKADATDGSATFMEGLVGVIINLWTGSKNFNDVRNYGVCMKLSSRPKSNSQNWTR